MTPSPSNGAPTAKSERERKEREREREGGGRMVNYCLKHQLPSYPSLFKSPIEAIDIPNRPPLARPNNDVEYAKLP